MTLKPISVLAASVVASTALANPFYTNTLDMTSFAQDILEERLSMAGPLFNGWEQTYKMGDPWLVAAGGINKAKHFDDEGGYKTKFAGGYAGYDHGIGDFRIGLAINAGGGKITGINIDELDVKTKWWGTNLYSTWKGKKVNVIANVGYLRTYDKSENELFNKTESRAITAGLKFETSFMVGPVSFVPYYGVRFTHLKGEGFDALDDQSGDISIHSKTAKLWQFPVGVNAGYEFTCGGGWKTRTFLDLGIVPTVGDRKVKNYTEFASSDSRIANTFLYKGQFGLETSKGQHAFGLNYRTAVANHGRFNQALTLNYQFMY